MANKVYTAYWQSNIIAGGTMSSTERIFSQGRTMKIKSITADHLTVQTAAPVPVYPEVSETQFFYLSVGNNVNPIGSIMQNLAGTPHINTGQYFWMTRSKQLLFDSFFVSEQLVFELFMSNRAAINITHYFSLIVEVEENIKYDT